MLKKLLILSACLFSVCMLPSCSKNKSLKDEMSLKDLIVNDDNNIRDIQKAIKKGADTNERDYKGRTALMEASSKGDTEIAKLLLKSGANVNLKDQEKKTALMVATEKGHLEIVNLLLQQGADVHEGDQNERTALIYAVLYQDEKFVKPLIQAGADVNSKEAVYGYSALFLAASHAKAEVAKALLQQGADANARNNEGRSVLMAAIAGHQNYPTTPAQKLKVVKILIQAGANVNARDHEGRTVLRYAELSNEADIEKALLRAGAIYFEFK